MRFLLNSPSIALTGEWGARLTFYSLPVVVALLGCAPATPAASPPAPSGSATAAQETPRQRLRRLLLAVEDAGPPLGVLSPALLTVGEKMLGRQSQDLRRQLREGKSAEVQGHPLFRLLAGGSHPDTLAGLAVGKGGADLVVLWQSMGERDFAPPASGRAGAAIARGDALVEAGGRTAQRGDRSRGGVVRRSRAGGSRHSPEEPCPRRD